MPNTEERQPHIDGLRAIAVLAVVAYHAKVPQLTGGFAGVDVFFVISGYLITGILLRDVQAGTFSFADFYSRRAKRLLPAALCAIAATLLIGCVILTPSDLQTLSGSAIASVFFAANYWFAAHSRYFDTATDLSPLTHMWSLAVEEQFYLLYPVFLLALMRRWGMPGVRRGILLTAIVSLALSALLSEPLPANSFYLLPARAWELLLGAGLCLWPWRDHISPPIAGAMGATGMAMVVASVFLLTPLTTYPGYAALLPTLGTALTLLFGHQTPLLDAFLTHPWVRRIGDFSYSAYLWHWPLIVYYRIYVGGREFTWQESGILFCASLLVGYLSWRAIEQPFRRRLATPRRVALAGAGAACALALCASLLMRSHGLPERVDKDLANVTNQEVLWTWPCPQPIKGLMERETWHCVVEDRWSTAHSHGIVWGDSHAEHWGPILHRAARKLGLSLIVVNVGCPAYVDDRFVSAAMAGTPRYGAMCARRNDGVRNWLARNPNVHVVLLAAAWSTRLRMLVPASQRTTTWIDHAEATNVQRSHWSEQALNGLMVEIAAPRRRVLMLGDVPRPNRYLNGCLFAERTWLLREPCGNVSQGLDATAVREYHAPSERAMAASAALNPSALFISSVDRLCNATRCATVLAGEWIYKDDNHLRRNMRTATRDALIQRLGLDSALASMVTAGQSGTQGITRRSASPGS